MFLLLGGEPIGMVAPWLLAPHRRELQWKAAQHITDSVHLVLNSLVT